MPPPPPQADVVLDPELKATIVAGVEEGIAKGEFGQSVRPPPLLLEESVFAVLCSVESVLMMVLAGLRVCLPSQHVRSALFWQAGRWRSWRRIGTRCCSRCSQPRQSLASSNVACGSVSRRRFV